MTARRDFQVRKSESFALEVNTTIKLFDGCAFTNFDLGHLFLSVSPLRRTGWYANRRLETSGHTVLQHDFAAH